MMYDVMMNPVAPSPSTAKHDLEKMSTNIDVFFSTRPRNIHTFELYLNLLAFKKEYKQAIETLNLMKDLGFEQTSKAFNYVILACANAGMTAEAQSVFTNAVQVLGKTNISIQLYTTLTFAYAKKGELQNAWDIISAVEKDTLLEADVVLYTAMIQYCVEHNDGHRAWHVYWHMQERDIQPDQVTYTHMIRLCSRTDMVERAISFYDEIVHRKLPPTEEIYINLIHACAGRKDLSFEFFAKMKEDGYHPDKITYNNLLLNCANRGDHETLEMIFNEMLYNEKRLGGLDSHCYNTLINGYAHAISVGMDLQTSNLFIAKGEVIFHKMKEKKVPITYVTLNVILKLYTEALREKAALECLDTRFKEYGVQPNVHTYAAMIKMYARMGEVEQAQEMYMKLRDTGVSPPYWVYKILVMGCVRMKYFKRAIKFMKEMKQLGIPPHIQDFKLFKRVTEREYPQLHDEIVKLCDWSFPKSQYLVRKW